MRDLILGLYKDQTNSETVFITYPENTFTMFPFNGSITGLRLVFRYYHGKTKTIIIHETEMGRTIENIGIFDSFWFEYKSTDKNYSVRVSLS